MTEIQAARDQLIQRFQDEEISDTVFASNMKYLSNHERSQTGDFASAGANAISNMTLEQLLKHGENLKANGDDFNAVIIREQVNQVDNSIEALRQDSSDERGVWV